MTEIMEDLDECVSNGKYTDGEYLALSKEIKMWYETYGKLEKLFTEIQRQIKGQLLDCFARFNGDPVETLDFLCYGELRDPKARARRAKWLRVWQGTPGFEKEYAFTELIVTIYGDNLVDNVLGDEGWGGEMLGWDLTHDLGIQLDDVLKSTEFYAQRREEGHYDMKEMFGV